jgi:glycosyltransferase involved in cell wall biosynthesis
MATIVLADDGIAFDGHTAETAPLGGAESAFVGLAEALAGRGHDVHVANRCAAPLDHKGVRWRPLGDGLPDDADLYIANRGHRLIGRVPEALTRVFWIHNPARYLLKGRYLARLAWWRPTIVFSGAYHASTYPAWAPSGGRLIIPYGVPDLFRGAAPRGEAPPPRAIFTSSPLRSLDWLLELWTTRIRPAVPRAELHVFSGAATYGAAGLAKAAEMQQVLERAGALAAAGAVLHGAVAKPALKAELAAARLYLYRGDINETFCMSAAEAQAMGVPAVVEPIGSLPERVEHGATGFVVRGAAEYAAAAVRLLSDDALWHAQHRAALERQGRFGWDDAARCFEKLLP